MLPGEAAVPSTPFLSLPPGQSIPGSRGSRTHVLFASAFSSSGSSTAALIQADLFCSSHTSSYLSPIALFRFRFLAALWLFAANLWMPLCEYENNRCAIGVDRSHDLGERGTLSGEGQPNPDSEADPASAHERTMWFISSLSYLISLCMCLYFLGHVLLAYTNQLLFKQCTSYAYEHLSVVSHSSTSAHPLTFAQKLLVIAFQIFVPTSLGVTILYFATILPYRQPLSWLVSIHLHLLVGLFSFIELMWNKLIFRPKAFLYWSFACLIYLVLLFIVFLQGGDFEYTSLNWKKNTKMAIASWICSVVFLGPVMFLACALLQFLRDKHRRALWTSAVDLGHESQTQRVEYVDNGSMLHRKGSYIQGTLQQFAATTHNGPSSPNTPRATAASMPNSSNYQVLVNGSPARPSSATRNRPSLNGGHSVGDVYASSNGHHNSYANGSSATAAESTNPASESLGIYGKSMSWIKSWWA